MEKSIFCSAGTRVLFLLSFLLCSNAIVFAQDYHNMIYCEDTTFYANRKKELRIDLQNLNFFRNNEYKGSLVKGYTLPGLWIRPTISYQPVSTIKIEAGAYMLKYWGQADYPNNHYGNLPYFEGEGEQKGFHALPFFRIRYAPVGGVSLVLGDIYGQNNHGLIEPLYNREMVMTSDPDAGVQLLWTNRIIDFDIWINWENFIFQGDDHQEEFTFGVSTRFKANRPLDYEKDSYKNNLHVYFPLQLLYKHKGGEINTSATSRGVKTCLNAAAGIGFDIRMPFRCFRRLNVEADAAYYSQQKGDLFPFENGYGIFGKIVADFNDIRLTAGYWQCHDFVSLFGDPLFGAVSAYEKGLTYSNPKTAYMRLEYSHRIAKGFTLGVHADVYNTFSSDMNKVSVSDEVLTSSYIGRSANSLSFIAGIYLRTDFSFLVKKFK